MNTAPLLVWSLHLTIIVLFIILLGSALASLVWESATIGHVAKHAISLQSTLIEPRSPVATQLSLYKEDAALKKRNGIVRYQHCFLMPHMPMCTSLLYPMEIKNERLIHGA